MRREIALLLAVTALPVLAHAQNVGDSWRARRSKGERPADERPVQGVPVDEEALEAFRKASEILGQTTDRRKIIRAAQTLENGFPDSRAVLVEMTYRGRKRAKAFALRLLGEKGNPEEDLPVVERALEDPEASVRLAAVMAIQRLGKQGSAALRAYLPTERKANNRKMAVKTLERWNDPHAIPFLVGFLREERHDGVRNFIVSALERLSGRKLGDNQDAWDAFLLDFVPPDQKSRHKDRLLRLLESRKRAEENKEDEEFYYYDYEDSSDGSGLQSEERSP